MFSEPSEDDMPPTIAELAHRSGDGLGYDLQEIGVYLKHRSIAATPAGGLEAGVLLSGLVGDVAFSDRVQHPDQESTNEAFARITDDAATDEVTAEYLRLRNKLLGGDDA